MWRYPENKTRAADRYNVKHDDEPTATQVDVVRQVIRVFRHLDRSAQHRRKQHRRNAEAQHDERHHALSSSAWWFDRPHRERNEDRQHDEPDQQIDPERDASDGVRNGSVESPPDERFVELMRTEE